MCTLSLPSYARCSSGGKEVKSSEGRSTFLFGDAFCSLAVLFGVLPARAAIENQMNPQLLPPNSISGGKQKPATVAGRKRGRGKRGVSRKAISFPPSPREGPRGDGTVPRGDVEEEPPALVARGASSAVDLGGFLCALTFPTNARHFPPSSVYDCFYRRTRPGVVVALPEATRMQFCVFINLSTFFTAERGWSLTPDGMLLRWCIFPLM